MNRSSLAKNVLNRIMLFGLGVIVYFGIQIPWHEIVGHGLVGMVCGGQMVRLQVFGLQAYPELKWTGLREGLGFCDVVKIPHQFGPPLTDLAGSGSTFLAALLATWLLIRHQWKGWRFAVTFSVWLWWSDLFYHTLPSFGMTHILGRGPLSSEPYEAALKLGIPGPLFQILVLAGTGLLIGLVLAQMLKRRKKGLTIPQ